MPKLSKEQLKSVRQARAQAKQEALERKMKEDPEYVPPAGGKKDSRGFTRDQRRELRENVNQKEKSIEVRYNINMSDLVELPDGTIGMVVKDAESVNLNKYQLYKADTKNAVSATKYANKVYVLTSSGNNWYLASHLRKIKTQ